MAAETDFHQNNCNGWSSLEIASENQSPQQAESVSDIRDHGSISFGRFAGETLSWERRSVFSHNRCQEELEKFKEPGFVAQKKAYFEEYYGRIRAMKASQADQQETAGFGRFRNAKSCVTQVETGNVSAFSKGETNSRRVQEVQTLESDAGAKSDSSSEGTAEKQDAATKANLSDRSSNDEKDRTTDASVESLCATEPDQPIKKASSLHTPFTRNSGNSQRESPVSKSAKRIANKPKAQGNEGFGSARERTKIGSRSTKDGDKLSEKTKPFPHNKITAKAESSIVLGKNSTHKAENDNKSIHVSSQRQLAEACSGSTVRHTSLARNRLVTPSPIGRIDQKNTNSCGRDLGDKFRRSLPGTTQSTQCSSKETASGGLEQKGAQNRLKTLHAHRSYDIERKQKEGESKSSITIGRGSKSATTTPPSGRKDLKMVQKNTISQPKNLAHARKEPRLKMPSWR
ncbi:protein WVD2-like 7 isoform X1 [Morus notabilis]|uniref:protein WVD2-like 7 isoform X1 n=1 Tax=Morus notabilis TaxID=981085 RepID=UPI000CED56CA|nr:protein WVD2-like 7 isoform X1 [Morus notabilis]